MSADLDHGALRELAAGAALDDLDAIERAALDQHLTSCGGCRALTHDLDDVVGELALAAPELRPPVSLRGEILSALRAPIRVEYAGGGTASLSMPVRPAATLAPAIPVPASPPTGRRRWQLPGWAPGLTAVAAGALALVLAVRTVQLDDRALLRDAAMTLLADPAHVEVALHAEAVAPDADALVIFRPGTTEAYLMATDLPATTDGRVYQLWVADAAGVHGLGTFTHDGGGPFIAPFRHDLADSDAAMVTLEPVGGAPAGAEPGPQVVFGELGA